MQNRIWQAEEEKWERRRKRAERVLTHIRELRRLEAEEEAEDEPAAAGQVDAAAGQVGAAAGSIAAPVTPTKMEPANERPVTSVESGDPKKPAREGVPELLSKGTPLTVKVMAETLGFSAQAIANAITELKNAGLVKEEKSTYPGFRFQYRLATEEERNEKLRPQEGEELI